ncbi:hypothetical protein LK996_09295 [Lysobacter sp. A6]|uniref:Uncharacterized protein n=1 Tax=Noviluteimonas lactosilytica TaxID=2888523 RepID=A0ABS8JIH3_9GAMM|nr:hypothetical protein [Lysobacter lactosilyticus]MCC8363268.1 hypothetical protein [Lysobacter lactosilyticus]
MAHHVMALILEQPRAALSVIKRLANKSAIKVTWLESLWDSVPDSRPDLIDLATSLGQANLEAVSALDWIIRWLALELGATDEDIRLPDPAHLWDIFGEQLKRTPSALEAIPPDWPGFSKAPKHFLERVYRCKFPALDNGLVAICDVSMLDRRLPSYSAYEQFAALDRKDRELADLWCPSTDSEKIRNAIAAQMLTARAAERCAARYFRALGLQVEDVARLQLDTTAADWRVMDLKVDSRYGVDVKNLRRTRHGGAHSSRWKVKAFKTDARGSEVLLCGVSSPYTTLDGHGGLKCETGTRMIVLGVTTASETRNLLRSFGHIYRLHVNAATKLVELPAWSWDYPNAHYRGRNTALRELVGWLASSEPGWIFRGAAEGIPPVLLALCDTSCSLETDAHTAGQRAFLTMLRAHVQRVRRNDDAVRGLPRLPELYLFVLHFWLHWRSQNDDVNTAELASLFKWGFSVSSESPRATAFGSPRTWQPVSLASSVGVVDPTDTIGALLKALATLEKNLSRSTFLELSDLTIFENGVLVGTLPDGRRRTLLAHCGGKDVLNNQADCGFRPLVFGHEETCACGRLICPQCKCCADPRFSVCAQQNKRLENLMTARFAEAE